MNNENRKEPELHCPFCGSSTRHIEPESERMIRLFGIADAIPAVMHDLGHRLNDFRWAMESIRDALQKSQPPQEMSERLRKDFERVKWAGEETMTLIQTLRAMYRPGERGVRPIAALPEEIARICKQARYRSNIDFDALSNSHLNIDFDGYLNVFFVALKDVLISLSRDRKPDLRISFNISDRALQTSFRVSHSSRLYDRAEPLWRKLHWNVKLAKGRFWLNNEDKQVTTLTWELPVVD